MTFRSDSNYSLAIMMAAAEEERKRINLTREVHLLKETN